MYVQQGYAFDSGILSVIWLFGVLRCITMELVVICFWCASEVNQIECASITFTWHNRYEDLKWIVKRVVQMEQLVFYVKETEPSSFRILYYSKPRLVDLQLAMQCSVTPHSVCSAYTGYVFCGTLVVAVSLRSPTVQMKLKSNLFWVICFRWNFAW